MINPIISFSTKLMLAISVAFCIHIAILSYLNHQIFQNRIILAYSINYLLAIVIYISLYKLRVKYLDILGFIFMAGSFLKFGVFFLFFFPFYRKDGDVSGLESFAFLAPYILCLSFETYYLVKLLNNKE